MAAASMARATASRVGAEPTALLTGDLTRAYLSFIIYHYIYRCPHACSGNGECVRDPRDGWRCELAHCCAIFLFYVGGEIYLVGQLTRCECEAGWRSPAHPAHQDCSLPQELVCGDGQDNDQGLS